LRVNLTEGTCCREETPDLIHECIGGRGLGAFLLHREVPHNAGPLGPDNRLIFMNGPLAGSLIPGSSKISVTFKSPLTESYSFSMCGGHFGPELRFAGLDGIIVEGSSEKPVYLAINNETAGLRDAARLWGKTIPETDVLIRKEHGGDGRMQIASIGPAGEKMNLMACITAGWYREFGRGGSGAVMGSKKLKAIAVRGKGDVEFFDPRGAAELAGGLARALREHPKGIERRRYGTPELLKTINEKGLFCTRNFQEGFFEEGFRLEGPKMREDIVIGDSSCYSCPVGCGKRSRVTDNNGSVLIEGPEFETIGLLGANCGISDWGTILRATEICDTYGFDTMNAGGCAALAMECYERGIITRADTGGLELRFGNGEALLGLLTLIAERKGIGDVLALGIKQAADHFGAPDLAMHSKGQGFAVYDPRGCKGMALTYAVSPKGAHHMTAITTGPEISGGTRLSSEGKGPLQREQQFSMCIADSVAVCSTVRAAISLKDQARAVRLVTGKDIDTETLERAAERIINLERMYNVRMGFSRKDDTLPRRFIEEVMTQGESAGETIDLGPMLDEYYDSMGWDRDGIPTAEKLRELGLFDRNDP